ncbi:MAG: hypothetical protein ACERKD_00150 [Prolixibacteraceae bacterium]
MAGEGSMFAAIASLKNNRRQLKDKNPFRKRVKDLHVHHIESHDTKHFSAEQMRKFKKQLRRQRIQDQRVTIITFVVLIVALIAVLILIKSLSIF